MVNISHRINEKNNTVYVTVTGQLTGEDMIRHPLKGDCQQKTPIHRK